MLLIYPFDTLTRMAEVPEVPTDSEFERDMVLFMNNKEKLVLLTLKAIRADIATLRTEIQKPRGSATTPPPEDLRLGSAA